MHFTMRKFVRFGSALMIVFFISLLPLEAQSSAFVGIFSDYETTSEKMGAGARGSYDYRTSLGSFGYLKITSFGELSYDFSSSDISDQFSADIENIWFMNEDELAISFGSQFSLSGYGDDAPYITPDWELAYRIFRGYRLLNPRFSYFGYASESQLFNGFQIGFEHAPEIEFSYNLALGGGLDSYYNANQPDVLASLSWGIHGLVGYSMNWDVRGNATYRASQDDTREGFSGGVSGQVTVTPSLWFQVYFSPSWHWSYLTSSKSWDMSVEFATRADFAINNRFYLYVNPTITMDNIQNPANTVGSTTITIGVDIGLL